MFRSLCAALALAVSLLPASAQSTRNARKLLKHGDMFIVSIRFSPDSSKIVSASLDGTVKMLDIQSGTLLWQVDLDDEAKAGVKTVSNILDMDLSRDGKLVAVSFSQDDVVGGMLHGSTRHQIAVLDAATGHEKLRLSGHTGLVGEIAFSPDGRLLLSSSSDESARLWDVLTGDTLYSIKLKEKGDSVAFSETGKVFAVATRPVHGLPPQSIVGLYDTQSGRLLREFPRGGNEVLTLSFTGDDLALVSGDSEKYQIEIWQREAAKPAKSFKHDKNPVKKIAFSGDGQLIAFIEACEGQESVTVKSLYDENSLLIKPEASAKINTLTFSFDGKLLAMGTEKGDVFISTIAQVP